MWTSERGRSRMWTVGCWEKQRPQGQSSPRGEQAEPPWGRGPPGAPRCPQVSQGQSPPGRTNFLPGASPGTFGPPAVYKSQTPYALKGMRWGGGGEVCGEERGLVTGPSLSSHEKDPMLGFWGEISHIKWNVDSEGSLGATWNMISYKVSVLEGQRGQQAHLQNLWRAETNVNEVIVRKLGSNTDSVAKTAVWPWVTHLTPACLSSLL